MLSAKRVCMYVCMYVCMPGSKMYDRQRVFEHTYMLKPPVKSQTRFSPWAR